METAQIVIEALLESGMKDQQAARAAAIYQEHNGRSLSLATIKKEYEYLKGNDHVRSVPAVLYSRLTRKRNGAKTSHLDDDRADRVTFDGQIYIGDGLPEWMATDKEKKEKAAERLAQIRQAILQGKKVTPWHTQLIEDCDRQPDMSLLSVAWVMEDHGLTL